MTILAKYYPNQIIDTLCLGMGNGVDQKYESFKSGNFALLYAFVCAENDSDKIWDRSDHSKYMF
jgi:hypothetical protein